MINNAKNLKVIKLNQVFNSKASMLKVWSGYYNSGYNFKEIV